MVSAKVEGCTAGPGAGISVASSGAPSMIDESSMPMMDGIGKLARRFNGYVVQQRKIVYDQTLCIYTQLNSVTNLSGWRCVFSA